MLCTGNICRSPAAEAMLRHRLDALGLESQVRSAGLLDDGRPAHTSSIDTLAGRGLDITAHRSRRLTASSIRAADLVLGMAREHVREAVVMVPSAFPKIFTLKELVRRGEAIGPRMGEESVADWLGRAHDGRTSADLLGESQTDDVADPIGLPRNAYERMVVELDDRLDRLVALLWAPNYERSYR
ncbi:MAG: protein-tyrosine phosphatase [Actinomycetota bacterium]|jgi:protein-tyrosine phosphatase|nr:protein-tyrosine phosphatase [Actinomycetota bacterium]